MITKVVESCSTIGLCCIIEAFESYPELHCEVVACKCSADAMNAICGRLSVMNLFYIEQVSKTFKLEKIIKSHYEATSHVFLRLFLNDVCDLNLMPNYKQQFLISEELSIRVEWDPSKKTCNDVKMLLQESFPKICCHLMPYQIQNVECDVICIKCYAPTYLHGFLCRRAKDNRRYMSDEGTLSVSIGGTFVWERNTKMEVWLTYIFQLMPKLQFNVCYRSSVLHTRRKWRYSCKTVFVWQCHSLTNLCRHSKLKRNICSCILRYSVACLFKVHVYSLKFLWHN